MTNEDIKPDIRICMGSSCFARGNRRNLEAIKKSLGEMGYDSSAARIEGCLCESQCSTGPHIRINGKLYNAVNPSSVSQLLEAHFPGKNGPGARGPDIKEKTENV